MSVGIHPLEIWNKVDTAKLVLICVRFRGSRTFLSLKKRAGLYIGVPILLSQYSVHLSKASFNFGTVS